MTVGQGRDTLKCIWFNATYLQDKFRAGMLLALYGKVEAGDRGGHRFEIIQPQFEILHDPTATRQPPATVTSRSGSRSRSAASSPSTKPPAMDVSPRAGFAA